MCGIIGAVGKHIDHNFLVDMFLATESRGKDATGFWSPTTGIVKDPSPVSQFIFQEAENFHKAVTESNVFLGHCRYATHGEPQFNYNNHPLESENWIIVHNGVVDIVDIEDYRYVSDTDTENILAYIETYGLVPALEKISRGAAIILYNKSEPDTMYLWRTQTQPMLIAYDQTHETIYVCSGDAYIKDSIMNISTFEERLGGLFSTTDRKIKLTDPKARDLWRITYKDEKLHARCVKQNIAIVHTTQGNRYSEYNHSWTWTYGYDYDWENDDSAFIDVGTGKYRPSVMEGKAVSTQDIKSIAKSKVDDYLDRKKKWEAKQAPTTTPTPSNGTKKSSITKCATQTTTSYLSNFNEGDIVVLKREPIETDTIYSTTPGLVAQLHKGTFLVVQRVLSNDRYVVEDIESNAFTLSASLLKDAEYPNCYGVSFDALSILCSKDCMMSVPCEDLCTRHEDEEMPECLGAYEGDEYEVCIECWFLGPCLREKAETEYGTEIIDVEYEEEDDSEESSSCAG